MGDDLKPTTEQLGLGAETPCAPGHEDCPQPITAWTTPEDSAALAEGLRMRENPAEWAFVRISRLIQDFESGLDENHEVGAHMVGGPGDGVFQVRDVGFWGPDFILFMGVNDHGKPIRLIQHYTQLNVLLSAMPKPEAKTPARRIGFQLQRRVEESQSKDD